MTSTRAMNLIRQWEEWVRAEPTIVSVVHFGSGAARESASLAMDGFADLDLHVVTTDANRLKSFNWATELSDCSYRFQAIREATGGVEKMTIVFEEGQVDLIIVPVMPMRLARLGLQLGLQRWHRRLGIALNEIHTCLRSGYRFIKGDKAWGGFYRKVAIEMEGVRLDDSSISRIADVAVLDLLWIWQKLASGEICAAQHILHSSVAATNFRLLRELRLRRKDPLPSFGLGRRVETLLSEEEVARIRVNARAEKSELQAALIQAKVALVALMRELVPTWQIPSLPEIDQV